MAKYKFVCPRCKRTFSEFHGITLDAENISTLGVVSRRDSSITICPKCGYQEGAFDLYIWLKG